MPGPPPPRGAEVSLSSLGRALFNSKLQTLQPPDILAAELAVAMWLHSPFLTTTALFPLIPCLGPLAGRLLTPIAAPASVGNNPIVARVPKQSGNHPKVLGESGPGAPPAGSRRPCHARGTCPGPAASWGGSRRAPRGGPAAMCSEPGGAAAAAFALSTFPAPRRAPSLPICGAHARS